MSSIFGSWVLAFTAASWLSASLPDDTPPLPPQVETEDPVEAFRRLGCGCDKALPEGMRCEVLPAFPDNAWIHQNVVAFVASVSDFAAYVEAASKTFPQEQCYLALQGWADNRQIREKKVWGAARAECRGKHAVNDLVDNRDLAFLRSCELRRLLRIKLDREVDLLRPVDFTEASKRVDPAVDYRGDKYKAVVLYIVFPKRRVCGADLR